MFVKLSRIVSLMKSAYKSGGLRLAADELFYSLEGRNWAMQIFKEHAPKEFIGEIIKLSGKLPDKGEQFLAGSEGNQEEIAYRPGDYLDVYRNALEAEAEGNQLDQSQFLLTTRAGTIYIVFQGGKRTYTMPASMATMIDRSYCTKNEELFPPYRGLAGAYYRRSDHMAMAISLYAPEELKPAVDFLDGEDLISIMEQA